MEFSAVDIGIIGAGFTVAVSCAAGFWRLMGWIDGIKNELDHRINETHKRITDQASIYMTKDDVKESFQRLEKTQDAIFAAIEILRTRLHDMNNEMHTQTTALELLKAANANLGKGGDE